MVQEVARIFITGLYVVSDQVSGTYVIQHRRGWYADHKLCVYKHLTRSFNDYFNVGYLYSTGD